MNDISLAHALIKKLSEKLKRFDVWMLVGQDEIEIGIGEHILWSSKKDGWGVSVDGIEKEWNKVRK
jgi:hypothetical protein